MDGDDRFAESLMRSHGVPEDVVAALALERVRAWGSSAQGHEAAARRRGRSSSRGRTLRVLHRPGHSPSDTVFFDESRADPPGPETT